MQHTRKPQMLLQRWLLLPSSMQMRPSSGLRDWG
jgi:hypothetical protein